MEGRATALFLFLCINSVMARSTPIPTFLTLIILTVFSACSKHAYPGSEKETILYPSPPDTARFQFLARYGASTDFTGQQSKFKTFIAGKQEVLPINKPYGISLHQGKLYIVDPEIAGLELIDFEENTFEYFHPSGRGRLLLPINCNFDMDGNLYISDVEREQVVIFDQDLKYSGEIGGEENFKPTDVAIAGDTIFITDPRNNRINAYNRMSRKLLFSFPENASAGDETWLYNPMNLYVAGGQVYVTDFGNSRVKIFNMNGTYLKSLGSYGRRPGQFVRPKGIAVDQDLNLFVVDAGFQNVQIFNKGGQLLMFMGGPYHGPGDMYLPANIIVDYDHLSLFNKYVDPEYKLEYLIFVTNQYGPDKVNVYGKIKAK